ncbi:MAG: alpha/beta hydrolase [Arcobacteraceae bacterium]
MKEKIYLLPGLMCNERLWDRLIPFLEDKYELIHIAIPNISSFDQIIHILDDIFKEDKINLFGFSFGAYIASYYTIKNPHKVKRLFLNAGTPSKMSEKEVEKRNNMIELMKTLGFNGLSRKKVISLLEETNQDDQALITLIQKMYTDLGEEVYLSQMKTINNRISLEKELLNLEIPIRFFYSTDDRLFTYESMEYFQVEHSNITKVSRVGTSHMIPLEFPQELSEQIELWMNNA